MPIKNTLESYGWLAKTLHWLLFLMILGAMIGGYLDSEMADGPEKQQAVAQHMGFGLTIILLVAFRLTWRLYNTQPTPSSELSDKETTIAKAMHYALYALMLAQPLSGMTMVMSKGYPVSWFGVFSVPPLVPTSDALNALAHETHELVWILLAILAVGHAGAAMKHHFIDKNDVLKRMLNG
jgi:cytochrome b561